MFVQILTHASIVALLSLIIGVLPLGAGIAYAIRPTEQRLALMRPLSLAGIFAALCGLLSGLVSALQTIAISQPPVESRLVALILAEALVPLFVASGCLAVAWLCAALGLRRHP
jgi:hypothetical protein